MSHGRDVGGDGATVCRSPSPAGPNGGDATRGPGRLGPPSRLLPGRGRRGRRPPDAGGGAASSLRGWLYPGRGTLGGWALGTRLRAAPHHPGRFSRGLRWLPIGPALARVEIHDLEGDSAAGGRWADSALALLPATERMLGESNPFPPLVRAGMLSRMGRHDSAVANAAEALRRSEADRIGHIDPGIRLGVAQVLMRAGRKDEAVARLEEVLRAQYMISAAWLAVDPTWAPLRGHPAFDRLVPVR